MTLIHAQDLTIDDLANLNSLKDPVYNGLDNCITFEIDEARQRLRRNDQLIYDFERAMQGPALEMMLRGFKVDINEREKAIISTKAKDEATTNIIFKIVSALTPNYTQKLPNSTQQLQRLFYDIMKLNKIKKYTSGELKLPMDRETLEKLEQQNIYASIIINAILFHRDLTKTLQVLETEIDNDWRWRCSYNIGGTKTGRWSSSKSPFGTGSNFQNVTEELRRVFIPDDGYKLYGIDKAQSESHDVGWYCGIELNDWSYLDACQSGDLHTTVTRMLYPEWSWTTDKAKNRQIAERRFYRLLTYRDASKRLAHATNYFGKPKEISRQTRIPINLVEEFQRRYFAAFPCITRMHQNIIQQVQRQRYTTNSFGRRRDYFDRPEDLDTIKSAIANQFQSATGDCLNLGLWRLQQNKELRYKYKLQILSQLHDAVYFQAPEALPGQAEQDMLRECLKCIEITQRDNKTNRTMTIPGEISGGKNWAHRYRRLDDGTLEDWNPSGLSPIARPVI